MLELLPSGSFEMLTMLAKCQPTIVNCTVRSFLSHYSLCKYMYAFIVKHIFLGLGLETSVSLCVVISGEGTTRASGG